MNHAEMLCYRKLLSAIIRQAVIDIWKFRLECKCTPVVKKPEETEQNFRNRIAWKKYAVARKQNNYDNAVFWLQNESGRFGFRYCCAHLGIDPDHLSGAILAGPPKNLKARAVYGLFDEVS